MYKFAPDAQVNETLAESMIEDAKTRVLCLAEAQFDESEISTVINNIVSESNELAIAMISIVESCSIQEAIVKHVNSKGEITRRKDRKTRERQAFQTTGLSKSTRRQIARKAVKTKRVNPSIGRIAQRKTKKALRKRAALGLDK